MSRLKVRRMVSWSQHAVSHLAHCFRCLTGSNEDVIVTDETLAVVRIAALGGALHRAIAEGRPARGEEVLGELRGVLRGIVSARESVAVAPVVVRRSGSTRLIVDALFLAASFRYVCGAGETAPGVAGDEVFHYCAGFEATPGTFIAAHLVPVRFERQSASYVKVDGGSNLASLSALDDWGLPLVAHFHSHPGYGPGATHPSGIDRAFQTRLEQGGHIAIGGIFSRDGHVRFFAGRGRQFDIEIRGGHVREVEKNVFKIDLDHGPLPVAHDSAAGR